MFRKLLFSIVAVIIIGVAAFNVSLFLNSEAKVNVTLASIVSLAKGEDGYGKCTPTSEEIISSHNPNLKHEYFYCESGGNQKCDEGEHTYWFIENNWKIMDSYCIPAPWCN